MGDNIIEKQPFHEFECHHHGSFCASVALSVDFYAIRTNIALTVNGNILCNQFRYRTLKYV